MVPSNHTFTFQLAYISIFKNYHVISKKDGTHIMNGWTYGTIFNVLLIWNAFELTHECSLSHEPKYWLNLNMK